MRVAIIDLGTNTFNLLVRDMNTDEVVWKDKIPVKLGEGGLDQNFIAPEPFRRGLDALKQHKLKAAEMDAKKIIAVATSAIRSTHNGKDFAKQAFEQTGINVNIIDGDTEAELIHMGVKKALPFGKQPTIIMDIGGGSTEFVIANDQTVFWKKSYALGTSRLMEKFKPADPISAEEVGELTSYMESTLEELITQADIHQAHQLIGSSGSFETLAQIANMQNFDEALSQSITTYQFDISQYRRISDEILEKDLAGRLAIPGMLKMRADMIGMACIQINTILDKIEIKDFKLSNFALKEGMMESIIKNDRPWQVYSL